MKTFEHIPEKPATRRKNSKPEEEPILQLIPNEEYVIIIREGKKYLKVKYDGTIENDHNMDLDEAAHTFWKVLATVYDVFKVKDKHG